MYNIIDRINCVKGKVRLFKVDVARAFRNLRVEPADAMKLGIRWKNNYYLDGSAVFGWVHGSAAFQLLSDAIAFIMAQKGYQMFAYIDDYILVNDIGDAGQAFDSLIHLLNELGIPINQDKLPPPPPCEKLTCLIDIRHNIVSIDKAKLEQIHEECISVTTLLTSLLTS